MIASPQFASCVDRLGWALVHSLWQFALLMLVALVLQRALQRCSAVTRYWALLATMCATVIAPVATWGLLFTSSPAAVDSGAPGQTAMVTIELPAYRAEQGAGVVPPLIDSPHPEVESLVQRDEPPNSAPTAHKAWLRNGWVKMQDSLRPWLSVIVCAWCIGVLAFAIRPLLGWYTVHRFRTVGVAQVPESVHSMLEQLSQRLGLLHAAQILQSTLVQAPVVAGYFRPAILVPMSVISGLPVTQLEAILAHELAHVRRGDYLVNLLQTLVETVFFYHPAVWWLSRQIRNERENCCDDMAVAVLGNGVDYGRALLAVAELHNTPSAIALGVRGGSLLGRVRRILEGEPSQHVFGGGMLFGLGLIVAATIVVLSALAPAGDTPPAAASASVAPAVSEQSSDPSWGEVSNGLRARVLAVPPETDEQKPGWKTAKRQATFVHGRDLTLLVELQNVSDEPLAFQGTRTSASGKSDSERFAPLLFDCEFFDKRGRPLEGSSFHFLDFQAEVLLSFGQTESLKPTASLVVLLQPGKWDAGLAENLEAGDYKLRVHYHGPAAGVLREMKQTRPQSPLASVWSGDAASGEASFRIAGGPESRPPDLAWGEPVNGLRAAVEFRSAAETPPVIRDTRDLASVTLPLGSQLNVYLHVQNTNSRVITFWSEARRQRDAVMLIDEGGKETRLSHAISFGRELQKHWTLKPGQTAILQAMPLGIFADEQAAKKFEHPPGPVVIGKPGKYRLRYDMHLSDTTIRKSKDGQQLVPGENDWQGAISTGIATITMPERRPEDDLVITNQSQLGGAAERPASPEESRDDEARRQEQERGTEARREALGAEIEQSARQGDQAALGRHWLELIALTDPSLRDCRQAIQHFEQSQDWRSLATACEATAKAMQGIILALPKRFTRPGRPGPPEGREGGPTVEVQIELDGVWHKAKGPAEGWFDWITRKQREMKGERFKVLCQLAAVYRDRLNEPEKAVTVLRESLADVPFFTMPLEKLIADQWPAKKREIGLSLELGIHRPAAVDLVAALEQLGQLDAAVEMQSRVVLASYEWGGLPYQDIEKLWTLLKKRPAASPPPRVAWLNLLSPDRPSIEFDLDSFSAPRTEYKLNQLSIAPLPGLEFESLELTVDMESPGGGYVQVFCSTLRNGKHDDLGSVKWHQDQRIGRESRTAKLNILEGTGVIYFNRSWLPDTNPDAITLHRISVRATFRSVPSGNAVGQGAEIPVVPATHRSQSDGDETARESAESATVTPQTADLAIEATILGLDGQPVAKSMVTFWREVPEGEATEDSDWRDPRTNKTWRAVHGSATGGTTQQTGLSPGTYLVTARDGHEYHAPFGASEPIQLDGSVRQQSVKVRLQPGGTLRVVVTDAGSDQVLTQASVILTATDVFLPPRTMIHSVRGGDTFVYDHLPPGNYHVSASKRAYAPDQLEYAMAGDAQPVTVAVGETRQIRIAVQGRPLTETEIGQRWPWIVRGRVTDKDGKPVEGATIRASAGWGSLFSAIIATTDKEGRYSGRFAQSGSVAMLAEDDPLNLVSAQVGAYKDGFAEVNLHRQGGMHAAYRQPRPDEKIPEYVKADQVFIRGEPREVDFVLAPAATIQSRVLNSAGQPVGDTNLSLTGLELPPASSVMASDKTDAEGKLLFTEIPVGYSWWFELSVERLKSARSVSMHFKAEQYDIVLQQQVEPATGALRLVLLSAQDAQGKDISQDIVADQPK